MWTVWTELTTDGKLGLAVMLLLFTGLQVAAIVLHLFSRRRTK